MAVNPKSLLNLKPWQKGKSGCPGGRAKDDVGLLLREFLKEEAVSKDGTRMVRLLAIMNRMFVDSVNGDHRATAIILDRAYGKPTQPLDMPEGGLIIQVMSGINPIEEPKQLPADDDTTDSQD